ncbi:hypothetical protein KQH54_03420 [bacterium]|nr:hypothetical protein [bacterium]
MQNLYPIILAIHNLLRWGILILALITIATTLFALITKKPWNARLSQLGLFYTISLDMQLLFGLLLYFIFSPYTQTFFGNISASMSNPTLRFFSIEHILIMVIAIVFAHIGSASRKKDLADEKKLRRAAIFFAISLILILSGIPWGNSPLFRGF